ncbi:hypothetical protein BZL41_15085 [Pseudomonas sp. PIC25]|uniref:DUF3775 domain-containing protein n=1 Tax=Pseudomonas sp. PIC25 TaxID=1958773 RepID=UPI000BAB6654|nr:DUF3775 domain-containing protein [Pseudomonas sp. PIC25]PAU60819.1 hypothetical protein BZL41_15085 [Pseudomonas sp. PIC25]
MLDVNPDTVCRLIALARAFHAKDVVVFPQEPTSPSDDWALQVLADHADDEVFQEFKSIIEDLEPDQQQQVVALLWLGRGDGDLEDWTALLQEARESWNTRTAEYLIAHPYLAEHLTDALDLQGYECE